jgi:hypothetical protein
MWHAAGFAGEDTAVLATVGITRKYGVEVISFSSPSGLVCMVVTDAYPCARWDLLNLRNRLTRSLFICTDTLVNKRNTTKTTQLSVLKIRDEVLYPGYWLISLSDRIELPKFVK